MFENLHYVETDRFEASVAAGERAQRAAHNLLAQIEGGDTRNLHRFKTDTRAALRGLLDYLADVVAIKDELAGMLQTNVAVEPKNNGKPWTANEDHLLVEERADGRSIQHIAMNLERSPMAVMTRLSTLVGISRTTLMERYIDGKLDGEEVRGVFQGEIRKVS